MPTTSTIFEGHFPGYPLMPGVLLIESMAQTSGWLVVAVNRFERMPFLAQVREAKFRTFVEPGQRLTVTATLDHDGSGYAMTDAKIALRGQAGVQRVAHLPRAAIPQRRDEPADARDRRPHRPAGERGAGRWLMPRARPGSPASVSSPASARGRTPIGRS